jgi:hypothetical protein
MKLQADTEFAAFIGIDWADTKHDLCLQTADGEKRELVVLPHRADAIEAWARSLQQRFAGRPVALWLEIAKGPLVYALQKYDFLVLFPGASSHPGKVPASVHAEPRQGGPHRCRTCRSCLRAKRRNGRSNNCTTSMR